MRCSEGLLKLSSPFLRTASTPQHCRKPTREKSSHHPKPGMIFLKVIICGADKNLEDLTLSSLGAKVIE
ncbi:hypothetical protein STEG23_026356 [Scotinomys teguina]